MSTVSGPLLKLSTKNSQPFDINRLTILIGISHRCRTLLTLPPLSSFLFTVGGDSYDDSISCSGGRRSDACFSARLMWRAASAGELYTYLPPYDDASGDYTANKAVCDVAPFSTCNPTYGASVGRGAFSFVAGGWTTISQRVRLNDVGQANGELELFVGGESVINVSGLILRARDAGRIRGVQMQTFFGGEFLFLSYSFDVVLVVEVGGLSFWCFTGSTEDYASPKDQNTYFSDFSVAITETL